MVILNVMQASIWPRLTYFLKDFTLYLILITLSFLAFIILASKISKSSYSQKKKGVFLAIIATIFLLILVFSLFEGYFRYVYDESDGLGYLKTNARWQSRHVTYNNYFVRDRNFTHDKNPGVTRIGVFGDSLAFGAGIKNPQDRFSNLLEKKLKGSGFNVEVFNLGRSGYDTEGEIKYYWEVKDLDFDIIVWEYYLNDIQPEKASTGTPIINSIRAPRIVKSLSKVSYFFDFLYWRFSSKYQSTFAKLKEADLNQYKNQELSSRHKEEIKNFISRLKEDNRKIVFIIFPFAHLLGPNYPAKEIHSTMTDVFKESGADVVVDLLPALIDKDPKDNIASRFDSHPNEIIHALAAEKLLEAVAPLMKND